MEIIRNEKTAVNTAELEIKVGAEEFAAARTEAYRKNVGKINVPGFRRGKAPQKIIESKYGKAVFYEDAVNLSAPRAYDAAIAEAGLTPVAQPEMEMISIDDEGYSFKAVVTLKPEPVMGDYKAIRVEKAAVEVTDEDVDAEIKKLAERNARIETVERAAADGDTAVIDYEGFADETAFEGGKGENYELKLGSGTFIPGFEEQIVGHSAGDEFDVNVTFPEEYHSEDLKGKTAVFKVKLHEVKETILPEIDDEFAKDVSEKDTLDELKAEQKEKLENSRKQQADSEFENAVLDKLAEVTEVEIPQAMIDSRIDSMAQEFAYRLQMQGIDMDTYFKMTGTTSEDFRAGYAENAARQVKISLALEAVSKLEAVEVTDEDVEESYKKMAGENGDVEKMKTYIDVESMKQNLTMEKTVELLKGIAAAE